VSRRRNWQAAVAVAALTLIPTVAVAAEGAGGVEETFKPDLEFKLEPYIPINLGPIDLSINKAVIYMLLSSIIAIVGSIIVIRGGLKMRPTKGQNIVEMVYEFAETNIARATLPKKVFAQWFPYVASLFVFILINNLISFIPLPFGHEKGGLGISWLPDLGLYAATANLSVTLALTIMTFVVSHYVGVKVHGGRGYWKTLKPHGVPKTKFAEKFIIYPLVYALELFGQVLRLISLSVRLFANMMAGHMLIIMAAGFAILVGSLVGAIAVPFGVFFYFFEWVLVAGLQAFIFAMLSGIYIGFAAEAPH
jgi:F-type H+-transporting ATPase subunit a